MTDLNTRINTSKSTQTDLPASKMCAFINVSLDNTIFHINCFYCDEFFSIWDCSSFVQHSQEKHCFEKYGNSENINITPIDLNIVKSENDNIIQKEEQNDTQFCLYEDLKMETYSEDISLDRTDFTTGTAKQLSNFDMDINNDPQCSSSKAKTTKAGSSKNKMPKKGEIRKWNQDKMKAAILDVRNGKLGLLLASKIYEVPRATLQRMARSDKPVDELLSTTLGRKPVFSKQFEEELIQYLLEIESRFWGLNKEDIRSLAFQLAKYKNIQNTFSVLKKSAGKDWLYGFLKRQKSVLSICTSLETSFDRSKGFKKENITIFYDLLEEEFRKHNFKPIRIYNVDETGLFAVQSDIPKVVERKGKRQIGALTLFERDFLITVISCISAEGIFVPPYFIFPRKNFSEQLMKDAPSGAEASCHISGWVQFEIFTKWFQHFIKHANPSKEEPTLLILDGYYSHTRNIEVINLARDNGVILLSLPPNSTHKMQPIKNSLMGPLKTYYSYEIEQFIKENERKVTQYDLVGLFSKAYFKVQSAQIAAKGFKQTGIYPFNRYIFSDEDFKVLGEYVTGDIHQPWLLPIKAPAEMLVLESQLSSSHSLCASALLPVPSTSCGSLTPLQISSLPQVVKDIASGQGNKKIEANVLTGLKDGMPHKIKRNSAEKNCKTNANLAKKISKQICDKIENPASVFDVSNAIKESEKATFVGVDAVPQEATCFYCTKSWKDENQQNEWTACLQCDMVWSHDKCVLDKNQIFICDSCAH